ncbi:hypothetical protein CRG98_043169 [Punica granatum]|uniref:HAT C-terminal dimerisation domain-containing protein n=1 Tax=Punica granatum TaxID=22663 RepID=A0A2I0HY36_PUNGR|nr:hypothetical protein CRG98_043169 [Punica granatum]
MESNTNWKSQPRNSASRLSASAEPFTSKRPPALLSKAHSFKPLSSCFDPETPSLGDYSPFHWQSYTPEALPEGLDLNNYGAILHGSEFLGSNCFANTANTVGSPYFGPSSDVGVNEKDTGNSISDPSLEKEAIVQVNCSSLDALLFAYGHLGNFNRKKRIANFGPRLSREGYEARRRSKSLDGTHDSLSRKSTGTSEGGAEPKSQPMEQISAENPSLIKSSYRITPITISRSSGVSSAPIISNFPLNAKPKDPEGCGKAEGSFILVDKNDLNSKEPDEDSPCWRGTMNSPKSPFRLSQSAETKFPENTSEARWTLNPMAPHFIPRSAERRLNWTGSSDSDEIRELGKDSLRDKGGSLCMLGPEVVPPILEEENITSHKNIVTGVDLQVPKNDVEDVSASEAFLRISYWLSMCPSLDAELVVDTMNDFSEFLVRKCSESHVLSEPLLGKIQSIIQNLSNCNGERDPGRSFTPPNESSAAILKIPNIETGRKVVTAASELDNADSNASVAGLEMDQRMSPQTLLIHSARDLVLSSMTRDIFATNVDTVASESTFSTCRRILDEFRSSLGPSMVEGLAFKT